ncbi:MAG: GDYXXLXY domain-containing protein [Candidatus Omnitrophota bacterium]
MDNKKYILVAMVAAQIILPANMIFQRENVLRYGLTYRFETAPVDPYDALRGRYVVLSVKNRSFEYKGGKEVVDGQTVYLLLEKDSDGYAYIKDILLQPPRLRNYIKTKVSYKRGNQLYFDLPFDRFYMNEYKAPKAEELYRKFSREGKKDGYVLVRVLNGAAVIEDLYLGGKPISGLFDN